MRNEAVESFHVLKVNGEYFQDAWEDLWGDDDDVNYSFTSSIQYAYKFRGGDWDAPKYLWNDRENKSIRTLEEAQEYFGGEILKVTKTIVTTWEVEE